MNWSTISGFIQKMLPSPFSIAIMLTVVAFFVALLCGDETTVLSLSETWMGGIWKNGQLVFAFQMMFMLVLGHVLALSKPVSKFVAFLVNRFCHDTASAAFTVTLFTMLMALFNWGLGLVFGAVFARKIADESFVNDRPLNFALIAACGYSGLMVWHGGFSGSSLVKVAEPGHLTELMGVEMAAIPLSETVFSLMNVSASLLILIIAPIIMRILGSRSPGSLLNLQIKQDENEQINASGADKLDVSTWFGKAIGFLVLTVVLVAAFRHPQCSSLGFITPNWINTLLLGLALSFHRSISSFLSSSKQAIKGASGILLQFPLYFGIAALIQDAGMIESFAKAVSNTSATGFNLLTFLSAGLVNVFVPSGGGQWVVQGPLIIEGCQNLNVPYAKAILALAYGDQLTNMLQPFWALPLLGITGLKIKDILPYTLLLMLVGLVVYLSVILVF